MNAENTMDTKDDELLVREELLVYPAQDQESQTDKGQCKSAAYT